MLPTQLRQQVDALRDTGNEHPIKAYTMGTVGARKERGGEGSNPPYSAEEKVAIQYVLERLRRHNKSDVRERGFEMQMVDVFWGEASWRRGVVEVPGSRMKRAFCVSLAAATEHASPLSLTPPTSTCSSSATGLSHPGTSKRNP